MMKNDIVIFKNGELELEVSVSENRENVWLTQKQIASLFNKDRRTITRHIQNIYKDDELDQNQYARILSILRQMVRSIQFSTII